MKYEHVTEARFLSRPNRFIALVETESGTEETVHVKNTGRCRELLIPGCKVYLAASDNPARRTKYDLIAVEKHREPLPPLLINMDSQIVNDVAAEWLESGADGLFSPQSVIRREVTHGDSRFDFMIQDGARCSFLEAKGVTLEKNGVAYFPDAPTERGVKHLRGLMSCLNEGYGAYVLFVVQMRGIREVRPNNAMHPAFGQTLREAVAAGVIPLCLECTVMSDSIACSGEIIPVTL